MHNIYNLKIDTQIMANRKGVYKRGNMLANKCQHLKQPAGWFAVFFYISFFLRSAFLNVHLFAFFNHLS